MKIIILALLLSSTLTFADDKVLTEKVTEVLKETAAIKPGGTRSDLQKYFKTEGGLSTATQRTYVSRRCPYIKVEVIFDAPKDESPKDKIEKISKPYLEYAIID